MLEFCCPHKLRDIKKKGCCSIMTSHENDWEPKHTKTFKAESIFCENLPKTFQKIKNTWVTYSLRPACLHGCLDFVVLRDTLIVMNFCIITHRQFHIWVISKKSSGTKHQPSAKRERWFRKSLLMCSVTSAACHSIYVKSNIKHQNRFHNLKLWLPDSPTSGDY